MTPRQRVHRRYHRNPWDLPGGRWSVQLVVQARRFFGATPTGPRQIFVAPFPHVSGR
jgi:hypothetical protein